LTRRHRIRGAAAFARIFRVGKRLQANRVQLLFAPAPESAGRFACVIGAKQVPRAVDRNRLKRMLREAIRVRRPSLQSFDVIVRLRSACVAAELPGVAAEAAELMDRLESGAGA